MLIFAVVVDWGTDKTEGAEANWVFDSAKECTDASWETPAIDWRSAVCLASASLVKLLFSEK
jgi:hypothetical protein